MLRMRPVGYQFVPLSGLYLGAAQVSMLVAVSMLAVQHHPNVASKLAMVSMSEQASTWQQVVVVVVQRPWVQVQPKVAYQLAMVSTLGRAY